MNKEERGPRYALTKREVISKARELFKPSRKGPQHKHDKWALFAEWVRSDPSQFRNVRQWVKSRHPEIHPITLAGESWGGYTFWNESREAFRHEGLERAIAKVPDQIAKRFENLFRVQGKLEKAIEKIAERILADMEEQDEVTGDPKEDRARKRETTAFNTRMMESLKDVQNGLADVNSKLAGNPSAGAPAARLDIFGIVMESVRQRNAEHGVVDAEVERPTN